MTDPQSPVTAKAAAPLLRPRWLTRIGEVARRRLIEKSVGAEGVDDGVVLSLPDGERRLSRAAATRLRDELTAALAGRRTFVRTVGEHREDGSYVVSRRAADSAGHQKRFRDFRAFERLYERLPAQFDAGSVGDVGGEGVSGTRRHLLVRHFAEHPAFDCELVAEQPLTVEKGGGQRRRRAGTEVTPTG